MFVQVREGSSRNLIIELVVVPKTNLRTATNIGSGASHEESLDLLIDRQRQPLPRFIRINGILP